MQIDKRYSEPYGTISQRERCQQCGNRTDPQKDSETQIVDAAFFAQVLHIEKHSKCRYDSPCNTQYWLASLHRRNCCIPPPSESGGGSGIRLLLGFRYNLSSEPT